MHNQYFVSVRDTSTVPSASAAKASNADSAAFLVTP